ncbi:MAG TPA: AI-2E family transporter, partial [Ktedonobacterales bacterium]|nr:AI-2E family transporter [Ktedonobacterales bacterium]
MSDDTPKGVIAAENAQGTNQGINWTRARDIPLAILGWMLLVFVSFWAAGHIIGTLLALAVAVLIAYALAPLVLILRRWMPWPIAIAVVYLVFAVLIGLLFFWIVETAIQQAGPLIKRVESLLTPGPTGNSPLIDFAYRIGITQGQISDFINALTSQVTGAARDVFPVVTGVAGGVVNIIVTLIISVYFVANAPRVGLWLRAGLPIRVRPR